MVSSHISFTLLPTNSNPDIQVKRENEDILAEGVTRYAFLRTTAEDEISITLAREVDTDCDGGDEFIRSCKPTSTAGHASYLTIGAGGGWARYVQLRDSDGMYYRHLVTNSVAHVATAWRHAKDGFTTGYMALDVVSCDKVDIDGDHIGTFKKTGAILLTVEDLAVIGFESEDGIDYCMQPWLQVPAPAVAAAKAPEVEALFAEPSDEVFGDDQVAAVSYGTQSPPDDMVSRPVAELKDADVDSVPFTAKTALRKADEIAGLVFASLGHWPPEVLVIGGNPGHLTRVFAAKGSLVTEVDRDNPRGRADAAWADRVTSRVLEVEPGGLLLPEIEPGGSGVPGFAIVDIAEDDYSDTGKREDTERSLAIADQLLAEGVRSVLCKVRSAPRDYGPAWFLDASAANSVEAYVPLGEWQSYPGSINVGLEDGRLVCEHPGREQTAQVAAVNALSGSLPAAWPRLAATTGLRTAARLRLGSTARLVASDLPTAEIMDRIGTGSLNIGNNPASAHGCRLAAIDWGPGVLAVIKGRHERLLGYAGAPEGPAPPIALFKHPCSGALLARLSALHAECDSRLARNGGVLPLVHLSVLASRTHFAAAERALHEITVVRGLHLHRHEVEHFLWVASNFGTYETRLQYMMAFAADKCNAARSVRNAIRPAHVVDAAVRDFVNAVVLLPRESIEALIDYDPNLCDYTGVSDLDLTEIDYGPSAPGLPATVSASSLRSGAASARRVAQGSRRQLAVPQRTSAPSLSPLAAVVGLGLGNSPGRLQPYRPPALRGRSPGTVSGSIDSGSRVRTGIADAQRDWRTPPASPAPPSPVHLFARPQHSPPHTPSHAASPAPPSHVQPPPPVPPSVPGAPLFRRRAPQPRPR